MADALKQARKKIATDSRVQTLDKDDNPVKRRIQDATAARELYQGFLEADDKGSRNRAVITAMFDGETPFKQTTLEKAGQGWRCNVNWGQAEQLLDSAQANYVDLLESVRTLIAVETDFPAKPSEKTRFEQIIAKKITELLRDWDDWHPTMLLLAVYFIEHGVGFCYFEDHLDWRPEESRLGEVFLPRNIKVAESCYFAWCIRKNYQIHELIEFISDEEDAEEEGWNVEAVKAVIKNAADSDETVRDYDDWEKVQEMIKNNDIGFSSKLDQVCVVNVFVREFDGTISHYRVDEEGETEEFMFEAPSRFENVHQALVTFVHGVGTNGQIHSVRGMGKRIFGPVSASNRLHCANYDGAMTSSGGMIQPESMKGISKMPVQNHGPYNVLAPGYKYVDRATPNLTTSTIPVLSMMERMIGERAGQYTRSAPLFDSSQKTRFQFAAELELNSRLSVTQLKLFYKALDRLFREIVRRLAREDYTEVEPGGDAVKWLHDELEKEGVPLEALFQINHRRTKARRALGNGSPEQRRAISQELMDKSSQFDAVGRQRLAYDATYDLVGDDATRYITEPEDNRVSIDGQMAELENIHLMEGQEIPVAPNQLHLDHLDKHVEQIAQLQLQVEEVNTREALAMAAEPMFYLHTHATAHVENLNTSDPNEAAMIGSYRKILTNVGETINNGLKALDKMRQEAAEQQAAQNGGVAENPELTGKLQAQLAKNVQELQHKEELFQQEMRHKAQEAQLDRRLKQLNNATDFSSLLR